MNPLSIMTAIPIIKQNFIPPYFLRFTPQKWKESFTQTTIPKSGNPKSTVRIPNLQTTIITTPRSWKSSISVFSDSIQFDHYHQFLCLPACLLNLKTHEIQDYHYFQIFCRTLQALVSQKSYPHLK